ncbi:DNA repair protein RadC [Paralimibaculum aggregatum]|uniref:DNA repair protein RadC n=1 Tax=Paralimibaculum aggregatum TaxID=3036245 RepID=A0ABQ6LPF4_9RHOB|nr:DNA repair protein RadC [Limibaculum sp. NKW23]GMG84200.1 DNA repair protein RadC [Limibaculum sp. NKW23]
MREDDEPGADGPAFDESAAPGLFGAETAPAARPGRRVRREPEPGAPGTGTGTGAAARAPAAQRPHFHDHRTRLRQRLLGAGPAGIADYEILELVLFRAIPRRDVKPLAKRLLERFGDVNAVISAPPARLAEVQGVGPAVICELKIVEAAAHRLARARVIGRPALSSWSALMEYCKTTMAHRDTEQFRILFLDRKNVLVADEEQARGTVDHVPVYPREVVKRALELNASAVILVHNHPSGDPTPSQADVEMTRRIEQAARAVGVVVHDHVVVGKAEDASFRALGLL